MIGSGKASSRAYALTKHYPRQNKKKKKKTDSRKTVKNKMEVQGASTGDPTKKASKGATKVVVNTVGVQLHQLVH